MDTHWQEKTRKTEDHMEEDSDIELAEMNLTWGKAQHVAMDRDRWRQMIAGLCPIGDEED